MAAENRRPIIPLVVIAVVVAVGVAVVATDRDETPGDAGAPPASLTAESVTESAPGGSGVPRVAAPSAGSTDRNGSPAGGFDAPTADAPAAADEASDATRVAIPIPLEFIEIFERNGSLAEFHAMLEGQAEDSAWALRLEEFIQSQLNSSLDLSEFRVLSIECRSSACEVLGMGYGENAVRGWMQGMFGLVEDEAAFEALVGGPGNMGCGFDELAPGVTALHCTLQRTDPALDNQEPEERFSLDAAYPDDPVYDRVVVPETVVPALETSASVYELHRRLELEPRDYAWANYIEPLLAEYLGQLDPAPDVDLLGVVCRATLCELQLQVPDEAAELDLMPHIIDFQRLDWHQLATVGINSADVEEGEPIGFVWFLERVPQN